MPDGYLVIMPEPRFSPLGNLPSPLLSEVKLTFVVILCWVNRYTPRHQEEGILHKVLLHHHVIKYNNMVP